MRAKRLPLIGLLGIALFIHALFSHAIAQDTTDSLLPLIPTPVVFPPPNQSLYPELICPYFAEIGSGSSWRGITIGESTRSDLKNVLSELGDYEIVYRQENSLSNAIRYQWSGSRTKAYAHQIPISVDLCLQDEVIVVMGVNWSDQPFPITDLIVTLGVPDVVTWSWTENRRVAFWFERGIASEIFAQRGDDASFGLVIRLFYFPPQSSEGYEGRWPFSVTRREPFHPIDPSIPSEQNPFDFEAMLATITSEPPQTPTPTN